MLLVIPPHRLLPALLLPLAAACAQQTQSEPPRSPDDPLILPAWAEAAPRADAHPKAPARQRETIVLGASDAPGRSPEAAGRADDARAPSTQYKFPANDTYGPFRPLYYRSMPPTYTTPGAGTSAPAQQPPIGRDWPDIPDHGPKFPFTTPVHP